MTDDSDPSDAGAPLGAPRPLRPTPELIAALLSTINEAEIAQELREIRSGGWRTLDQFIGELEQAVREQRR
jgi:hypothetical protein